MKSLSSALVLLAAPLPVQAGELAVHAAPAKAKLYQSVLITVETSEPSVVGEPPEVTLTIADGRDRRRTQRMFPAGARRWQCRFTPQTVGRHTGTVVLEAGAGREIGLVPAIEVRTSAHRGFVRSVAKRGRMFTCDAGGLFPMGLTIPRAAASETAWQVEFDRLRGYGVNFVRMELPWDPAFPDSTNEPKAAEAAERWLLAAERAGLFVQLRMAGPRGAAPGGRAAYARLLELAADRWGPFASLAAWELDAAVFTRDAAGLRDAVASLRTRDPQRHLIALPAQTTSDPAWSAGADFLVSPEPPSSSRREEPRWPAPVLLVSAAGAVDPWAGLFASGLGIPVAVHGPGIDPAWELPELPAVAELARSIPWGAPARALVAPGAAPGADLRWLCYGDVVLLRAEPRSGSGSQGDEGGCDAVVRGLGTGARLRVFRADGSVARQEPLAPNGSAVEVHLREPGRRAVVATISPDPPAAALKASGRQTRRSRRR